METSPSKKVFWPLMSFSHHLREATQPHFPAGRLRPRGDKTPTRPCRQASVLLILMRKRPEAAKSEEGADTQGMNGFIGPGKGADAEQKTSLRPSLRPSPPHQQPVPTAGCVSG